MTTDILYYPTKTDIDRIKFSIQRFLKNQHGKYRDQMLHDIRCILDKYRVSKINIDTFSVHRTSASGLSYIQGHLETKTQYCPYCNQDIYIPNSPVRILSVLEGTMDKVTYGCICGFIFFKFEKNDKNM
ncbi:hypothetical protein JCM14036_08760 [Desulfotomaculum defluvii]